MNFDTGLAYLKEAGSDGMLGDCIYSVSKLSSGSFPRMDWSSLGGMLPSQVLLLCLLS